MPESHSPSRRWWRLGILIAAFGGLIWQTGSRPAVCLVDPAVLAAVEPAADLVVASRGRDVSVEPGPEVAFAPRQLWAPIPDPASAAEWEARVPAASRAVDYVAINHALLHGKSAVVWRAGEQLELPLPSGETVVVEVTRTSAWGPDRYVVEGVLPGVAESRFLMAVNDQHVAVAVDGLAAGELKVRSLGEAGFPVAQLYTVDETLEAQCGAQEPGRHVEDMLRFQQASETGLAETAAAEPLSSGQAVIDVMIAYTADAREALGSTAAMINQIDLSFAKVQSDFANSGVTAQFRLVDTMEVELPGDGEGGSEASWQDDALEALVGTQDGVMDEVHARRDEVGADLVSLVVRRGDADSAGIAYLMQGLDSTLDVFLSFSVVSFATLSDGVVLTHEIGHNFGCAHDRENSGGSGIFDYSFGYRASGGLSSGGTVQVRTIMAYSPGTRVRYFSSPENTVSSYTNLSRTFTFSEPVVLGVAAGEDGESDNVSTINQTAFKVANYRLAPDRGDAGRLVNVSTRAWVESGDRTLIGGFVLNGEGTKRVLIRAPGPTIGAAPFNVPDALADPELRVDWINVGVIAENDDWGLPAENGIAVAAASTVAGAFTLPNGSLDAGVVLDLESPANYTASVMGSGGSAGYGLVEVYEVGESADEARLLNLSTRGYADRARPMVAGFVVNADPGAEDQRKTMFIRVRGPSLANYGLPESSLMADPMIEIYDANAQLIYVNDDWDPPTTDVDGSARDGIPWVRREQIDQPSEEAVFAAAQYAGATDMEPVEPAVVLELPAGIYTVMVMPFEQLPAQPEEPGVAIVEVFELDVP